VKKVSAEIPPINQNDPKRKVTAVSGLEAVAILSIKLKITFSIIIDILAHLDLNDSFKYRL